jgi:deoxyribodipyrimidine photo-lyase
MINNTITSDYNKIIEALSNINPVAYARSRNYVDGAVTYLSPYISRGVISTRQVMEAILQNGYCIEEAEKLIQELAWREYFQRVWQFLEDDMFEDIRHRYTGIQHKQIPQAVIQANTGIEAVDKAIHQLYNTGYMHNHVRMYTASIACNIAKGHWQVPANWMYYHLLDGDLASNTCSWQWVAGTFSSKKYYCNQENINKYTGTAQTNTFLDVDYASLPNVNIPDALKTLTTQDLKTILPEKKYPEINTSLPVLLYNSYNLDPIWRADKSANRILVLEPSHFKQFPVSEKVMTFILELANNIEGLQIFAGEVSELTELQHVPAVYTKEHPAFKHYPGIKDEREWMFPQVKGYYNSFFSFWKKCEKQLKKKEECQLHYTFTLAS